MEPEGRTEDAPFEEDENAPGDDSYDWDEDWGIWQVDDPDDGWRNTPYNMETARRGLPHRGVAEMKKG